MRWSHYPEVSFIEGCNDGLIEALSNRDDRCVGGVKTDIGVGIDKVGDTRPVTNGVVMSGPGWASSSWRQR